MGILELYADQSEIYHTVLMYTINTKVPVNVPGMKKKHDENSFLVCETGQWVIGTLCTLITFGSNYPLL